MATNYSNNRADQEQTPVHSLCRHQRTNTCFRQNPVRKSSESPELPTRIVLEASGVCSRPLSNSHPRRHHETAHKWKSILTRAA